MVREVRGRPEELDWHGVPRSKHCGDAAGEGRRLVRG